MAKRSMRDVFMSWSRRFKGDRVDVPVDHFRMLQKVSSDGAWAKTVASELGADCPSLVGTFLLAAQVDAADCLLILLDAGVAVDSRDKNGATAAMGAAACDSPGTLRILLDRGADRAATAKDGRGILDFAKEKNAISCLALLAADAERDELSQGVGSATSKSDPRRI